MQNPGTDIYGIFSFTDDQGEYWLIDGTYYPVPYRPYTLNRLRAYPFRFDELGRPIAQKGKQYDRDDFLLMKKQGTKGA